MIIQQNGESQSLLWLSTLLNDHSNVLSLCDCCEKAGIQTNVGMVTLSFFRRDHNNRCCSLVAH